MWANPSSPHAEGRKARALLEDARERIKAALGWPAELIFTSGASEAAERAFAIALGRRQATDDEDVDLIYSRLSHPNAEILEDHLVPLERGAQCAAVFNSGMAAIATCCFAFLPRGSALLGA